MRDSEWVEALYVSQVEQNPQRTIEAQQDVCKRMVERSCIFGGEPLPHFLKPYFLSPEQTELLSQKAECLVGVLEKITQLYFSHPEFRTAFELSPDAARLIEIDPGYGRSIVISRPDAFLDGDRLQFIEFNCDSPAGAMYTDLEEEIFLDAFPMTAMAESVQWTSLSRKRAALDALLGCYKDFGGTQTNPTIAIMDWRDVKTQHEFKLLKEYFESEGYPTLIVDPRDLKLDKGELKTGKTRIDIIYRRAIFYELLAKIDEIGDLIRAYSEHKVCMVNPLRSRLAANKSMLTLLTNTAYDYLFSDEENAVKQAYIPWTRKLVDAERFYGGRKQYVKELVNDHRRNMVLKPAEGYGGKDVYIGCDLSGDRWEALVNRALQSEEDWVVQEYVPIPETAVPVFKSGELEWVDKKVNINPYIFNGRYAGGIARLSDQRVINVSAGGGLVPAISFERKHAHS